MPVGPGRWALPSANAATVLAKQIGGVLSHRSAATWWGWEQKSADHLADVTLPRNRTVPSELRGQVTPHWADLAEAEIDWGRTSRERTIVDCLRSLPFDEALAIADSAVRADDFTQPQLVALVSGLRGPGGRQARRVAALATSRSANPFESVLRAIAVDIPGLSVMAQCPVTLVSGREIHPDMGDPVLFVAIEAEGFATHGKRAALRRDCRRYNDLARVGWIVLRFTWEDVMFRPEDVRAVLIDVVAVRAAA